MKLLFENWRKYLQEGGLAMSTPGIPKEFIKPTLDKYYEELRRLYPQYKEVFSSFVPMGSARDAVKDEAAEEDSDDAKKKKKISGDIDLGLDVKWLFPDKVLTEKIGKKVANSWVAGSGERWAERWHKVNARAKTSTKEETAVRVLLEILAKDIQERSGGVIETKTEIKLLEMFSSFPQYDLDGNKTGERVQIDWMIGNLPWLVWAHWSDTTPQDEKLIKGLHRTQLLVSLFSAGGYTFRHKGGIRNKKTGETVVRTPTEALELIYNIYGARMAEDDTKNFNSLYNWVIANLREEDRDKVFDSYLRILNFTKSKRIEDEETGESIDCGYIPRVLEDYWIENRERLGLTGQYICRQTNPKLWGAIKQ